jgi:uncharacterized protein YbcI
MTESPQSPGTPHHDVTSAISNGMVRLYKDLFGRGPGSARTYFAGPDMTRASVDGGGQGPRAP